ncbi:TetR/AcrR family transcriptional regulator [Geomicrobium sp. JCM 19055]|uniref:TetR/AcrR family transcriptional regulator n=1 Tax=Geomicrobium sp. JCM 19055 TaxID=1460649 RepID=UPI0022355DC0|nr:TetR/AcrR family transcriptional regulator [Geomicrobium sp. JCM 19055]
MDAASIIFARRGMAGTKISEIAKEAKLSHGLVYHYFNSKEHLFFELVKKASERSMGSVTKAMQREGTPLEKLSQMTEEILRSIARGNELYLFVIMIQASTSDAVPDDVTNLLRDEQNSPVKAILPIIMAGQEQGEIVDDSPVQLAVAYYAMIQGLAINKLQWAECPIPEASLILRLFTSKGGE